MHALPAGDGPLFLDPSTARLRAAFRGKARALTDKLSTVAEAVARLIRDGDYLAIGGFGGDRLPTAVVHEIVRQGKQNLAFAGHTATHDFQILCAGNLTGRGRTIAKVDSAYIVGLEARGLSPHARRVMESGEIEVCEWTNYALAVRLHAAAIGVPFLPTHTMLGTDTFAKSAAKVIECPFTGEKLAALPALSPDVAAIHVHDADIELARASKRLIITCERLIPHDEIRRDPSLTAIPFLCVDAVCEVPYGSYPGNMPYEYFSDETHLRQWLEVEKDPGQYKRFLDDYLFGVKDFDGYLQKCGGLPRLMELRRQEFLLDRPG
jgi:glutaconate CoA-transferase, subunit A